MKARLAHEHWSLVADKPGETSLKDIEKGDFASVAFEKAIERVETVTASAFLRADKDLLKKIARHRNKVVHFYHQDLDTADPKLLADAAAEQCRAWILVERLVTKDWKEAFDADQGPWAELRTSFKKSAVFLKEKFVSIRGDLAALRKEGVEVVDCHSCGYSSAEADEYFHKVFGLHCLVCDASYVEARVPCPSPNCDTIYTGEPEISPYCGDCDKDLWGVMDVADKATAYCAGCNWGSPTAHASLSDDGYMCACCLSEGQAAECGSCGALWLEASKELLEFGCQECMDRD
jgi:hypothetical protein